MPLVVRTETIDSPEALRSLAAELIDREQSVAWRNGDADDVSCRSGCTACCHQAVPVGPTELAALRNAIAELPEPVRTRVDERIVATGAKLRSLGFDSAGVPQGERSRERGAWSRRYFEAQVPCPLLEGDTCVARDARPLVCRDYLVTSDPVHCQNLDAERVVRVRLGRDVASGFAAAETELGRRGFEILALALAEPAPDGFEVDFEPMALSEAIGQLAGTS